jgi:hypothetical protein
VSAATIEKVTGGRYRAVEGGTRTAEAGLPFSIPVPSSGVEDAC